MFWNSFIFMTVFLMLVLEYEWGCIIAHPASRFQIWVRVYLLHLWCLVVRFLLFEAVPMVMLLNSKTGTALVKNISFYTTGQFYVAEKIQRCVLSFAKHNFTCPICKSCVCYVFAMIWCFWYVSQRFATCCYVLLCFRLVCCAFMFCNVLNMCLQCFAKILFCFALLSYVFVMIW